MKKYSSLLCVISFVSFFASAQNKTYSTHQIIYSGYTDLNTDLTNKLPDLEHTILYSNERSFTWNSLAQDFKAVNNDTTRTVVPNKQIFSPIYKDYLNGKMYFQYNSAFLKEKDQFYTDAIVPMQWVITNRTKKIDTMLCIKALTIFRGRAYSAWFNPNIAISEGPWKFGGLPGLIIELYDEERNIYWKLKQINALKTELPQNPKSIGDFLYFKKEFNLGYKRFVLANEADQPVNPGCSGCFKNSEIKVKTIENLVD